VWRPGEAGRPEILLVHRPRYDDWSLPKGKLDHDETHEAAALREVEEETGLRCALGPELPSASYVDSRGRSKVVRYWVMEVVSGGAWEPDDEVDALCWVPADEAGERVTYARDATVVGAALATIG
jgi:8-oxo-dGTP diphosphatase